MKTRTNWLRPRKPKVKMCDHNGTKSMLWLPLSWLPLSNEKHFALQSKPKPVLRNHIMLSGCPCWNWNEVFSYYLFQWLFLDLNLYELKKSEGAREYNTWWKTQGEVPALWRCFKLVEVPIYLPICNLVTICLWLTAVPHLDYSRHRQGVTTHFLPSGPCRGLLST